MWTQPIELNNRVHKFNVSYVVTWAKSLSIIFSRTFLREYAVKVVHDCKLFDVSILITICNTFKSEKSNWGWTSFRILFLHIITFYNIVAHYAAFYYCLLLYIWNISDRHTFYIVAAVVLIKAAVPDFPFSSNSRMRKSNLKCLLQPFLACTNSTIHVAEFMCTCTTFSLQSTIYVTVTSINPRSSAHSSEFVIAYNVWSIIKTYTNSAQSTSLDAVNDYYIALSSMHIWYWRDSLCVSLSTMAKNTKLKEKW